MALEAHVSCTCFGQAVRKAIVFSILIEFVQSKHFLAQQYLQNKKLRPKCRDERLFWLIWRENYVKSALHQKQL